jgi:hypothetical protein
MVKLWSLPSQRMFSRTQEIDSRNKSETLDQYRTDFEVPDFSLTDPLLHYCREDSFNYTFATLQRFPKTFNLTYYDLREKDFPDLYECAMDMFRKQVGVLLQHQRTKRNRFEVLTKKSHDSGYQMYPQPPYYPKDEVPSLLEFLNRADFPEHDELRFKLLKWMIDERKLKDVDLAVIPKNYFLDVLVLTWMVRFEFITKTEADFFLLTIKRVETKNIPENLQPPTVLNKRAFLIAHLFPWFHRMIRRCLEVTGLKKSMKVSGKSMKSRNTRKVFVRSQKLINFNGVLFHKMYVNFTAKDVSPRTALVDLEHIRIYK